MASFNKVILLGNLTRDPEVRYTPKGSAVCDLGIAVNRTYTLDNGEKREEVTYVDVTLWARLAEIAGEYLKKGRPVFIEGRLQLDYLGRQTERPEAQQIAGHRRNHAAAGQSSQRRWRGRRRWWRGRPTSSEQTCCSTESGCCGSRAGRRRNSVLVQQGVTASQPSLVFL